MVALRLTMVFLAVRLAAAAPATLDGSHDVVTNTAPGVDIAELVAALDVLRRSHYDFSAETFKRDIGANDIMLRSYRDEDCACRPKVKPTCSAPNSSHSKHKANKPVDTPEVHKADPSVKSKPSKVSHHHPKTTDKSSPVHHKKPKVTHPSCKSGYTFINEGHQVVNSEDNDLLDLKNINVDLDILSLGGQRTSSATVQGNFKCNSKGGCCAKAHVCSSGFTFINDGQAVHKTDDDLLDLKNLDVSLSVLSLNGARSAVKTVKGDTTCSSTHGCCVKPSFGTAYCASGFTFVNKGHAVVQKSDNDLVDLKNLNVDLSLLSLSGARSAVKTVNGDSTCSSAHGCCVKPSFASSSCSSGFAFVNKGDALVSKTDNDLVDLKNLDVNLSLLSLDGSRSALKTVKGNSKCSAAGGCCVKPIKHNKAHSPAVTCKSGYSFVNLDHIFLSKADSDLADLKHSKFNVFLLGNDGEPKLTTDKACKSATGCCVATHKVVASSSNDKNDHALLNTKNLASGGLGLNL